VTSPPFFLAPPPSTTTSPIPTLPHPASCVL